MAYVVRAQGLLPKLYSYTGRFDALLEWSAQFLTYADEVSEGCGPMRDSRDSLSHRSAVYSYTNEMLAT